MTGGASFIARQPLLPSEAPRVLLAMDAGW
jgi:hypothetical protein